MQDLVENRAEIAQIFRYNIIRGGHYLVMKWGPEKTCVNAENIRRNRRESVLVLRNSRRMVAVTSASPKAVVVASMLC